MGGGGKKGDSGQTQLSSQISQQEIALQKQVFGLAQNAFNTGMKAWTPAFDYWTQLLKGGNAAVQATGPAADLISQAGTAARNNIANTLPTGGERNLAMAESNVNQQNSISRLYAGIQPQAAQMLGALSGIPMGISPGFAGSSAGMGSSLLNYAGGLNQQQAQSKNSAGQGVGELAGMLIMK